MHRHQPAAEEHWRLVQNAAGESSGRVVQPRAGGEDGDGQRWGNASSHLLVLQPVQDNGEPAAVVEIVARPGVDAQTQHGYLRFMQQVGELIEGWYSRRGVQAKQQQHHLWGEVQGVVEVEHRGLESKATALGKATEARRLLQSGRASVAVLRGGRAKIEAVSGQDVVDRRP